MAKEAGKQLGKLREFSMQLAEKLKAAKYTPSEPIRLALRIGALSYLLPMVSAGEIVALPVIAPVPWTKPWFRGLANVRGRLTGVVDLQHLAGRGPLPAEQSQQLLVLAESHNVNTALLISRAFGLRNLNDLESLGRASDQPLSWEQTRFRDLDGAVLTELDLGALIRSEAFATIGI